VVLPYIEEMVVVVGEVEELVGRIVGLKVWHDPKD